MEQQHTDKTNLPQVTFHTNPRVDKSANSFKNNKESKTKGENLNAIANKVDKSKPKARSPVAVSGRSLPEYFKSRLKRFSTNSREGKWQWMAVSDGEPHVTIFLNNESAEIVSQLWADRKFKLNAEGGTVNISTLPPGTPLKYDDFHVTFNATKDVMGKTGERYFYDAHTCLPSTSRHSMSDLMDTNYSEGWKKANMKVEEIFNKPAAVINDYLNELNPAHNLPGTKPAEVKEEKPVETKAEKSAVMMMPPSVRAAMLRAAAAKKAPVEKRPRTSSNEELNKQDREKVFKPDDPNKQ